MMKVLTNLNLVTNLLLTLKIVISCILGDFLLNKFQQNHLLRALTDNFTHQIVGLLSAIIISLNLKATVGYLSGTEVTLLAIFGQLSAGIIDIDHFIEAQSLQLADAIRLTHRPFLHNSTIAVLMLIIALFIAKTYGRVSIWLLVLFCSITTHHVRDGYRRGLWFHGFGHTRALPYWSYIAAEALLPHVTVVLARLAMNRFESKAYHLLEMSPVIEA